MIVVMRLLLSLWSKHHILQLLFGAKFSFHLICLYVKTKPIVNLIQQTNAGIKQMKELYKYQNNNRNVTKQTIYLQLRIN